MSPDVDSLFQIDQSIACILPYKYKMRSGRHVLGQTRYDPFLDSKNWNKDLIDPKKGSLKDEAIKNAILLTDQKPQFLTKFGKERLASIEKRLFPQIVTNEDYNGT